MGGSWFIDFSVTVKTEFSWTQSQEISITEEETLEESFTITCPENKNLVYCVWQLIDEYSIVDSTGTEIFTAVKFVFDDEVLMSSIPTEDLVPMTTYFDN